MPTPSQIFAENVAKAERTYAESKAAVLLAPTHFALRDAKIAREKARLALEHVKRLASWAENQEDLDERRFLWGDEA